MPRGRGGRRNGKAGQSYPQRSDLNKQPVRVATGQTYGQAGQQAAAQQAVPLPQQTMAPAASPQGGGVAAMLAGAPGLTDPSNRPDEPITAGLPSGPGPGPEALNLGRGGDTVLDELRGLYLAHPNEDLRRVIAEAEQR